MKILIMGLPGSGKTWLAERLKKHTGWGWFNADEIRGMASDWEFGHEARLRQARRMNNLAQFESSNGRIVMCDFVCPLPETREIFNADYVIWVNTIEEGRFEDTNKMFVEPEYYDTLILKHLTDDQIEELAKNLKEKFNETS
jgi:adenylylsulfate kinase